MRATTQTQDTANGAEYVAAVARRVDRTRRQIDVLAWVGIVLGLAFTMVNVQTFAASGARPWSLPWLVAWLLDPMVSLVLVAVLRAEQITAAYQVPGDRWMKRTKWFTFTATYVMNTWSSWAVLDPASIVLHSVPPALVFIVAETAPVLRDRLTEAANRAAAVHEPPSVNITPPEDVNAAEPVPELRPVHEAVNAAPSRKRFTDFLDTARAAYTPGTEVTPAWVRQHVNCSRGSSQKVADALRRELTDEAAA